MAWILILAAVFVGGFLLGALAMLSERNAAVERARQDFQRALSEVFDPPDLSHDKNPERLELHHSTRTDRAA